MSKHKSKQKQPKLNKPFFNQVKEVQQKAEAEGLSSLQRGELYYNMLLNMSNLDRGALGQRMGKSFSGERDLYESAGYKQELDFEDYYARYRRQDISKKIVDFFPEETWSTFPKITDNEEDTESEFESAVDDLIEQSHLQEYFKRVDKLAGIGEFAVLFLGFDDGKEFSQPVQSASELLYVTPYKQNNVTISTYVKDKTDSRFGLPEIYEIQMQIGQSSTTVRVHHTRILHVAENPEECDYIGTPRLEDVFNRLQDIETIVAGATEMFWKGGFTGTLYQIDKDFDIDDKSLESVKSSISDFEHDLKRYLLVKGVEGKQLDTSVESPKDHVNVELDLIAGAKGIPKRILIGTEEGKLAGEQDSEHLMGRVSARRDTFATSVIIRPFIDRMIEVNVLPAPNEETYSVKWPNVDTDSPQEKIDVSKGIVDVMATYIEKGVDALIPPEYFLTKVLNFSKEEADEILTAVMLSYSEEEAPEDTGEETTATGE